MSNLGLDHLGQSRKEKPTEKIIPGDRKNAREGSRKAALAAHHRQKRPGHHTADAGQEATEARWRTEKTWAEGISGGGQRGARDEGQEAQGRLRRLRKNGHGAKEEKRDPAGGSS